MSAKMKSTRSARSWWVNPSSSPSGMSDSLEACIFAIGVQDIDQQLFLPAASRTGQIRPDGESVAAQAVAGLTTLLEYGLAALVVAAQLESGQKTPDHFVALVVRPGADELDGALLEGRIRMLPQGHDLHQGQIATLYGAPFHRAKQP